MRKIEKILIGVALLGVLFKIMRYPLSSELIIMSLGSFSFIYMGFSFMLFNNISIKNVLKKNSYTEHKQRYPASAVLGYVLAIAIMAILFKLMAWPFTSELMFISFLPLLIALGFSIYKNAAAKDNFYKNIILRISIWLVILILIFNLPKNYIRNHKYSDYPEYLEAFENYEENPTDENLIKLETLEDLMYQQLDEKYK